MVRENSEVVIIYPEHIEYKGFNIKVMEVIKKKKQENSIEYINDLPRPSVCSDFPCSSSRTLWRNDRRHWSCRPPGRSSQRRPDAQAGDAMGFDSLPVENHNFLQVNHL